MQDFKRKRRLKQLFYSPLSVIVFLLLAFFLARGAWSAYHKSSEAETSLAEAKREYAELENRQIFLAGEIERLSTNRGQEEELRSRYSVAKDGEQRVIIVEDVSTSSAASGGNHDSIWGRFLNLFK